MFYSELCHIACRLGFVCVAILGMVELRGIEPRTS